MEMTRLVDMLHDFTRVVYSVQMIPEEKRDSHILSPVAVKENTEEERWGWNMRHIKMITVTHTDETHANNF